MKNSLFSSRNRIHAIYIGLAILLLSGCTYQVNSDLDLPDNNPGDYDCDAGDGLCTLRAAIMEANASATSDTILVPAGTYDLDLAFDSGGGRLIVAGSVKIQGSGKNNTIINQATTDGVIQIDSGNVRVNNVTVQGGYNQAGAGIRVTGGDVDMTDIIIEDNFGFTGGGGLLVDEGADVTIRRASIQDNSAQGAFGGGVWNQGTLWIYDSAITNNDSNRAGGVRNSGNLNLRNVTVSGNTANSPDAGVGGISQNGFAVLNNVTVTENNGSGNSPTSFRGGGIQSSDSATTVVKNSIIANNDGGTGPDDCVGTLTGDSKYNLIGDTDGCTIPSYVSTFILDQAAGLNGLSFNGGTTLSHMTGVNSPARDTGYQYPQPAADGCEPYDQRGVPRPQGVGTCDMGAVEYTSASYHVTGYRLVDALDYSDIRPLLHGDIVDLSELPNQISIRAVTNSSPGSVVFEFDGNSTYQIEENAPYALAGDTGEEYNPVSFSAGSYSIRATPYTLVDGEGAAGGSLGISFRVVD